MGGGILLDNTRWDWAPGSQWDILIPACLSPLTPACLCSLQHGTSHPLPTLPLASSHTFSRRLPLLLAACLLCLATSPAHLPVHHSILPPSLPFASPSLLTLGAATALWQLPRSLPLPYCGRLLPAWEGFGSGPRSSHYHTCYTAWDSWEEEEGLGGRRFPPARHYHFPTLPRAAGTWEWAFSTYRHACSLYQGGCPHLPRFLPATPQRPAFPTSHSLPPPVPELPHLPCLPALPLGTFCLGADSLPRRHRLPLRLPLAACRLLPFLLYARLTPFSPLLYKLHLPTSGQGEPYRERGVGRTGGALC